MPVCTLTFPKTEEQIGNNLRASSDNLRQITEQWEVIRDIKRKA